MAVCLRGYEGGFSARVDVCKMYLVGFESDQRGSFFKGGVECTSVHPIGRQAPNIYIYNRNYFFFKGAFLPLTVSHVIFFTSIFRKGNMKLIAQY